MLQTVSGPTSFDVNGAALDDPVRNAVPSQGFIYYEGNYGADSPFSSYQTSFHHPATFEGVGAWFEVLDVAAGRARRARTWWCCARAGLSRRAPSAGRAGAARALSRGGGARSARVLRAPCSSAAAWSRSRGSRRESARAHCAEHVEPEPPRRGGSHAPRREPSPHGHATARNGSSISIDQTHHCFPGHPGRADPKRPTGCASRARGKRAGRGPATHREEVARLRITPRCARSRSSPGRRVPRRTPCQASSHADSSAGS